MKSTNPPWLRRWIFCLVILLCALLATSSAYAAVSLPLGGYCKPGRYFPVQLDGADAAGAVVLSAEGCMDSTADATLSTRRVIPMLAMGEPRQLRWGGGSLQLRTPAEDERLIAAIGQQIDPAAVMFPGKRLIPISLDPADLLPGPPAAWETLDAVLLESSQFVRITDPQRSAFLAGGVTLISIGQAAPDTAWPWRQVGSVWVLSFPVAGPIGQVINENIYAPTFAWVPGWSGIVRAQIMSVATLVMLLTIAAWLLPSRVGRWLATAVPLAATAGIMIWRQSLGPVDRAGGDVIIAGNGWIQRDALVYERGKARSIQTIPWTGWTHPLFASAASIKNNGMKLHNGADNQLSFVYKTQPDHTMAFLRRDMQPGAAPAFSTDRGSPMREAAKLEYLSPGETIAGEAPAAPTRWPDVVIEKK